MGPCTSTPWGAVQVNRVLAIGKHLYVLVLTPSNTNFGKPCQWYIWPLDENQRSSQDSKILTIKRHVQVLVLALSTSVAKCVYESQVDCQHKILYEP